MTDSNSTNTQPEPEKEEEKPAIPEGVKNVTEASKKTENEDEYTTREKGFIVGLVIQGFFNLVFMIVIGYLVCKVKEYTDRKSLY